MDCLEWEHVWARYDRRWVLRDVSLHAEPLRTLYLVGPSGGGKTALLRVAAGQLCPEAGRVWVNSHALRRGRRHLLTPADMPSPHLSVERGMALRLQGTGVRGRPADRRLGNALRVWDLEGWREARVRTLPDSVRQRVHLATQWACPGAAWLLDNPTALLEPEWCAAFPSLLNMWREREGGAVIVATNHVEEAMAADTVTILHAGRVAATGAPPQLCRVSGAEEIVLRTVDDRAAAIALASDLRLEAERCPDGLMLRVRRADDTLPGVLQTLGSRVETVWVRRPTMEDAIAYHTTLPAPPDLPTHPPLPARDGRR